MKLVNRKNVISVICVTYTVISILLTIINILIEGEMNSTQLNIFTCLLFYLLTEDI